MGAPYASRTLVFHLLIALSVAFIAVYRAELYQLPASAWALAAAVGFLGFFVPWGVPTGLRASLLGGRWPLVIVVPFVGLLLSPRLIPSPVMVGPFLLCAAAAFSTCLVVLWNTSRRRRAVRRLLERPEALEPGVRSRLESYFTAVTPLVEGTSNRSKPLQRALRAQAWLPGRGIERTQPPCCVNASSFSARVKPTGQCPLRRRCCSRIRKQRTHRPSGCTRLF